MTALAPVAGALDAALTLGILPRDLSPEGILVAADDGRGLLGDIGIASALFERDDLYRLTHAGFLSPEEIRLEPADATSTVYSFTCVLYECLTGSPPFDLETPALMLYAHCCEPPPRATDPNRALPTPIDAVLERGMDKARFASPGELMSAAAQDGVLVAEFKRAVLVPRKDPG